VELGPMLLPAHVVAKDAEVLAAPISLVAEPPNALTVAPRSIASRLVRHDAASASWEWRGRSADFEIISKMTAECDGCCWYEIELKPRGTTVLRSLRLEIPRTKASARYLHTSKYDWSNVSQGLPELGGHWTSEFLPYLWLGDEQRGLAWFAEAHEASDLQHPEKAISVETQAETVVCSINYVDHERSVSEPIVLRFGFQASPVKNVSFQWRAKARIVHDIHYESCEPGADGKCELDMLRDGGAKTVVIHDSWTKYFGEMQPADPERFQKLIKACHARGLRLLVYVGYGIARTAPELQGKHDQWSVMPLIPWDPGYKPETRAFDATCPRSGWADWLVKGADELFASYKLDGLYFDGTSEAWRCLNQAHGCGWKDRAGNVHSEFPMLAARDLIKRLAATVRRHNPNAILDVHMSSNLTLPTLSFCDSLWNGEQFETHTAAEKFEVPLHAFRTEFMGYAHGLDMEFLCYENRPFTFNEAIALAWLHGVEVRPYPKNLQYVTHLWQAMDQFGTTQAQWHPYWLKPLAVSDHEDTKISGWAKGHEALLFISHLARSDETIAVQVDANKMGLRGGTMNVIDGFTGNRIPMQGNSKFSLDFKGMDYRLVKVL
jgi:hypothetical protein